MLKLHPRYRIVHIGDEWAIKRKGFWGDTYFDLDAPEHWWSKTDKYFWKDCWSKDAQKVMMLYRKLIDDRYQDG